MDKQKSEYLADFSCARKKVAETHIEFAHRLKRYYSRGTGNAILNAGENLALVEAFLNGLSQSEGTALRLCASSNELEDVMKLAQRASRSRGSGRSDEVNALQQALQETRKEIAELKDGKNYANRQNFGQKRWKKGKCHYCQIPGHFWRDCRKRAYESPNWVPKEENKNEKVNEAESDKNKQQ